MIKENILSGQHEYFSSCRESGWFHQGGQTVCVHVDA